MEVSVSTLSTHHLDQELAKLEVTAAAFARHFIPDAKVRRDYIEQTRKFSIELRETVAKNRLSSRMAAHQAHSMRNAILEAQRNKSNALGFSIAKFLKKEGKTLYELESKYAVQLFDNGFDRLNLEQRNEVWRLIVRKSGEARASASGGAKWLGRAGKGLFVLTVAISIYHIATAEDKIRATANEGVAVGGGIAGASALGAAGLACGPAAIACVPIGIFVGGILGALGADWAFDKIWE